MMRNGTGGDGVRFENAFLRGRHGLPWGDDGVVWERDAFVLLVLLGVVTVALVALGGALDTLLDGEAAPASPSSFSMMAAGLAVEVSEVTPEGGEVGASLPVTALVNGALAGAAVVALALAGVDRRKEGP